ncbi:zinc finger, C2H2 type [Dictyocaulus viviparus]|uniref:Zinc finger, C2H2 type n=1 Tax=Dictyocaulus viviparus TaxID=29172 RepID=A0A0D8XMC6_DICVI|nr:zinc finger, C2H2 type [Dictyocaulus viviparus]
MSVSDFWAHRLISTSLPPSVSSCSIVTSENTSKTSETSILLKPEALKPMMNYGALQLLQFQMMWQPHLFQNFLTMIQHEQEQRQQHEKLKEIVSEVVTSPRKRSPSVQEVKKSKQRKLGDDTVNSSPDESMVPSAEELQKDADSIDETAAYVEVSEESRKKIKAIENVIGDSVCCLCKVRYDDVFKLAQHRCPRIAHEEYRCPECEKIFSCPANLASHRRWHRPREQMDTLRCTTCLTIFSTRKDMKAHVCQETPTAPTMQFGKLFSSLLPDSLKLKKIRNS